MLINFQKLTVNRFETTKITYITRFAFIKYFFLKSIDVSVIYYIIKRMFWNLDATWCLNVRSQG
jgi:hypothetical protein